MLRRLIIAVFGLGLIVALSGAAFAVPGPVVSDEIVAPDRFIPSNPKLTQLDDARPAQPTFKKPSSALRELPPGTPPPAAPSQTYFCDLQGYAGGPWFFWTIPDAYGDDLFNTRFTVEAGFECTLKVAHLLMYEPGFVGAADMRVYLWDDDGFGFPGSVLDSVDIPNATILAATGGGLGYVAADFSAAGWVFQDGDEYHYGWTPIGGAPGDGLAIISDDGGGPHAGEERSSEYYLGVWGSMLNDWGLDVVFDILSERCCNEIPFSDCYTQSYWQNIAFFWRAPHPVWGDEEYAMRFDVGGPETLTSVDLYIYDPGDGSAGNDDVYITVYDDDGTGLPGAMLDQRTLTAGTYSFFPALTSVSFAPLVLTGKFHVSFGSSGIAGVDYESCLSSDGTDGVGRSSSDWGGGFWVDMLTGWGVDVNFLFDANLCRDEFSDCTIQNYAPNVDAIYPVPDGNPIIEWAQKFSGFGAECEVRELEVCFARSGTFDVGNPDRDSMYTKNTNVYIRADAGGVPGAILHTSVLTPADYAAAGYTGPAYAGQFRITIPGLNVVVPSNFWVGVEAQAATRDTGIRVCLDILGGGAGVNDGLFGNAPAFGGWLDVPSIFGWDEDAGMDVTAEVCCIPFSGRTCAPPDIWAMQSHDFARSGASQAGIDDAWCDLITDWYYETPANTTPTASPIIYGDRVYLSTAAALGDASKIEVLDLISGANLYTIDDVDLGNFIFNDPVIIGGTLYVAGGDKRTITAWDITTTPATKLWGRQFGGLVGPLRSGNIVLLNVGGTDVLYVGSEVGRVVAVNAADGLDYPGWSANPVTLDAGQLVRGTATDGSALFFATRIGGLDGDVWSIDPATGSVNWQFSTAGGFQGGTVYPVVTAEQFTNISYDNGVLFVGSRVSGDFPADGILYRIAAADGSFLSATASNGFLYSNPIIDVNLVYCMTISGWIPAPQGPEELYAVNKNSGGVAWKADYIYDGGRNGYYWGNGALTCEPEPLADIIISTDNNGAIHFNNSVDGTEIFRRRWDFGGFGSAGAGSTVGVDSNGDVHVLVANGFGAVVDMVKGLDDRPRMEIQDYDPTLAVEFSVATSIIDGIPSFVVNTGCAPLTISGVNVDIVSNGSTDPDIVSIDVVDNELLNKSTDLAERLTSSEKFASFFEQVSLDNPAAASLTTTREEGYRSERINRTATALPPYLNGVVEPFAGQVIAPGDTIPLTLDINPSMIQRGPQTFYIALASDDADFFVNAASPALPSLEPEITVTFVGGCLIDTTTLEFGVGSANMQFVTNTSRLADGDWDPHGFDVDGENAPMYQGTYVFGVSTERIAMNTPDWSGSTGPEASWISVQGDPNWCDMTCKPALTTGVALGAMWDGSSYAPISGNMVCVSWIDSVQDFSLLPGPGVDLPNWDWRNYGAPFDDSLTMGLAAHTRTIGVVDVPELANLTLEIFDVYERNGNPVPGWKFGSFIDFDLVFVFTGNPDTALIDRSISTAWCTDNLLTGSAAWGQIKIPFGCGYEPAKNVYAVDEDQGQFNTSGGRGDPYWDSAYYYMSLPPGASGHVVSGTGDQAWHATLVEHDFAGSDTITFAVGTFAFNSGIADVSDGASFAPLANLVNKWAGFGRGDVNDDNAVNLGDIITLAGIVNGSVAGAIPFEHLADVNADGGVDVADLNYLIDYYFNCGPCPAGDWMF